MSDRRFFIVAIDGMDEDADEWLLGEVAGALAPGGMAGAAEVVPLYNEKNGKHYIHVVVNVTTQGEDDK